MYPDLPCCLIQGRAQQFTIQLPLMATRVIFTSMGLLDRLLLNGSGHIWIIQYTHTHTCTVHTHARYTHAYTCTVYTHVHSIHTHTHAQYTHTHSIHTRMHSIHTHACTVHAYTAHTYIHTVHTHQLFSLKNLPDGTHCFLHLLVC